MKNIFKKIIKMILLLLIIFSVFIISFILINKKLNKNKEIENLDILGIQNTIVNQKRDDSKTNIFNKLIDTKLEDKPITSNTKNSNNTDINPYYYGVGEKGLDTTQVSMLTKDFRKNTPSITIPFSPTGEVWYFAYPESYPPLTSIRDQNGFELINDFKISTGNSILNEKGEKVSYRVYEYVNVTTLSGYKVSYIQ